MKAILNSFKNIKWWEYLYMGIFLAAIITVGVIFKSSALVIINALVGVTSIFFIAKGMIIGNIIGIAQCVLYAIISYFNQYFGEVILCLCITLPTYCLSIFTWLRNMRKKEVVVQVNRVLSIKEWIISIVTVACISVGIYYLLRHFNTANLLVSTFGVAFTTMAGYLIIRRCEYTFVFYILNNITAIYLWSSVIANGDISSAPTLMNFLVFFILNVFGFINWILIKKSQNKPQVVEENKQEKDESDK